MDVSCSLCSKIKQEVMNIKENKHHILWGDTQSIEVIKSFLTPDEYKGFLKGNILKYQLRLGKKDSVVQDMKKIKDYTDELEKG